MVVIDDGGINCCQIVRNVSVFKHSHRCFDGIEAAVLRAEQVLLIDDCSSHHDSQQSLNRYFFIQQLPDGLSLDVAGFIFLCVRQM